MLRTRWALLGVVGAALLALVVAGVIFNERRKGEQVAFVTLAESTFFASVRDIHRASPEPELFVVQSEQEATELEQSPQFAGGGDGAFSVSNEPLFLQARAVNFRENLIVFVFQGVQPTTGYGVTVTEVRVAKGVVNLYATFDSPKRWYDEWLGGTLTGQLATDPSHIVVIPREGIGPGRVVFNLFDGGTLVYSAGVTIVQ